MFSLDNLVCVAIPAAVIAYAAFSNWRRSKRDTRLRHLREAPFPPGLFDKLSTQRPDIPSTEHPRIERALRDFFATYLMSGFKPVSMPSQAVDALWHEFILYTKHYDTFCRNAFGRFLHHMPAAVLTRNYDRNVGLRRVWWHACKLERIDPRKPARLPLLFALDAELGLADGFRYALDCSGLRERQNDDGSGATPGSQCATDMGSSSYDGTTDGFGDSGSGDSGGGDGGSSDSGGSDSGSSCSSCSGGCGGGGGGD